MSEDIGINSNIRVGKKRLHLQTFLLNESQKIETSIFDQGRLVDKRICFIDENIAADGIEKQVRQYHETIITDLELLFFVTSKIESTNNASYIEKLGHLFFEKGFYDEAKSQFELAFKMDPANKMLRFQLGNVLFKKGDFKGALEYYLAVVDNYPTYPDVHFMIGQAYYKLHEYSKSINMIEKALVLNNDYPMAHYILGLILVDSLSACPQTSDLEGPIERTKTAVNHFNHAIRLSNDFNAALISNGIEKLHDPAKTNEAFFDFESAYQEPTIVKNTLAIDGEFYLKFMFAGLDKDNKELSHFIVTLEKAVHQHPEYTDIRQSLGMAYLIRGWHYFVKAIEEFRVVVKINQSFEKGQKRLKLLENEARGFLILLRTILK
jgi:tetratricopeptide (TPR) repeat protein